MAASLTIFTIILLYSTYVFGEHTLKLSDGYDIPAIALGTWLGHNTESKLTAHNNETTQAVVWALDAGYRHIDTAYRYKIEDQVGDALRLRRDQIPREQLFITTKLWNEFHAREQVVPALRKSLAALQLDYVDLYLIHWPLGQFANRSYDLTDYLDTWQGMVDAKRLGLVRSIGVSNFNQKMIDRILENGLEKPVALQVEVNLNLQQPELLAYCREKDIVVMGYTPFGNLFGGRGQDAAPPPRHDDPQLLRIASKYGKTSSQVVIRYLIELGVIPLPKSVNKSRIEQNLQVFDFSLTAEDKQQLAKYDVGYRTIPQLKWKDHPYYPF